MFPGFSKLMRLGCLQSEYLLATRPEVSVGTLEGGEDYYIACLKFHTSTNLTPQEIHNLGITEVARIQDEVKKVRNGAQLSVKY